jgi:hypothetical protein
VVAAVLGDPDRGAGVMRGWPGAGEAELAGAVEGGGAYRLGWPTAGSGGGRCASGGTAAVTSVGISISPFCFCFFRIIEDFM